MKLFFKKTSKLNRGFTLIETLVSISIFTVSILALLSVLTQSVADTSFAKRKIIATYLGAEGVEYIRNMRDTYVLYSSSTAAGWIDFNNNLIDASACQGVNGCYFDDRNVSLTDSSMAMMDLILTACTNSTCSNHPLLYDSTTGKYGYETGSSSGYARQIKISQVNANETKVFSTIYWTQGSGEKSITFSDNLFNWIEQ